MHKSDVKYKCHDRDVNPISVALEKNFYYRWRCEACWFFGVVLLGEAGGFTMSRQGSSLRSLARRFIACRTTINVLQHLQK